MSARIVRMMSRPAAPLQPAVAAPVAAPAPAPAPAPVNVDFSELATLLRENNALQKQILSELQRKKKWSFDMARDAMGRPFQIDATEVSK